MPQPIRLTFDNLSRLADNLSDNNSIIVKNNSFETRGKIGAFFAHKSSNRQAGEVLFQGIRQRYGDTVASALAPQIRAARERGKPLTARTVRDVLTQASEMADGLTRINKDMARHFVLGSGLAGDTRNLDTAFAAFCAQKNIDPAAHQPLKNAFGEAIQKMAEGENQNMLSFERLGELVRQGELPAMKKAWNEAQVEMFLNDPQGMDAAMDACAANKGLDDAQKAVLRQTAAMALSLAAEAAAEKGTPFNAQTMFRDVSNASLEAMQSILFVHGKGAAPTDQARDGMGWATPATMADMAILCARLGRVGMAPLSLATQRLDAMRQQQPAGLLSRETLWQGCFNEPLPDTVKNSDQNGFTDAMFYRLNKDFQDLRPGDPVGPTMGLTVLCSGVSLDKAKASLQGPITLGLADFPNRPSLTQPAALGSLAEVEVSLAKDIMRRGSHCAIPGYKPTISFSMPGQAGAAAHTETISIQDTQGMSEADKKKFESGEPSPMSRNLADHALRLCNGNEVQARQVILSMSQSGAFLVRTNSYVTGITESEHSPLDIDIRREDNGNVTMRFFKPESSPLDMDYTYTITPDGHGTLTACRIQARQTTAAE